VRSGPHLKACQGTVAARILVRQIGGSGTLFVLPLCESCSFRATTSGRIEIAAATLGHQGLDIGSRDVEEATHLAGSIIWENNGAIS